MARALLATLVALSFTGAASWHGAALRLRPTPSRTAAVTLCDAPAPKPKKRSVRYLREDEMEAHVAAAAREQGLDDSAAKMIAACSRNIYALGCLYHPDTVARIASVCSPAAKAGEPWAILLTNCIAGKMPRLRSQATAAARMAAAQRKRAAAPPAGA